MSTQAITLPKFRVPDLTRTYDIFFILLGGLPLALPLLWYLGESELGSRQPIHWFFWMHIVTSAPHVYLTYMRLQRKIGEGRTSSFIGWPLYGLLATTIYMGAQAGYYLAIMTFVNVVQSWHYLRQVYGVQRLLYGSKNESPEQRRLVFWAYHLPIPFFVIGRWHVIYLVWNGRPSDVIQPVLFPNAVLVALGTLAVFGLLLGIWLELNRKQKNWGSLVLFGVYFAIHIYGFLIPSHYQRGFMAVTIFHAAQYMGVLWKRERQFGWISRVDRYLPAGIGFVLFWVFGIGLAQMADKGSLFLNQFALMLGATALGAVSAHHYIIDALIWKKKAGS